MTTQTATATAAPLRTLEIDRSHSEVAFQVRHLLSKVRGRFSDFDGTITFDDANPQNSRVDVTIQAAEASTPPKAIAISTFAAPISSTSTTTRRSSFASTSVTPGGDNVYDVAGESHHPRHY